MQYVMKGAIDAASSSEPMGVLRACQSKPVRGMPMPPSLILMLGHSATAAMPLRQVASTSLSRLAYGPIRSNTAGMSRDRDFPWQAASLRNGHSDQHTRILASPYAVNACVSDGPIDDFLGPGLPRRLA